MNLSRRSESVQSRLTRYARISVVLATLSTLATPGMGLAQTPSDSGSEGEWNRFKNRESLIKSSAGGAGEATGSGGQGVSGSGAGQFQPTKQGYFVVPGYFANQSKPYERPTETFRTPTLLQGQAQANSGINAFAATLPFTTGIGYGGFGYGNWLGGSWGAPGFGYGGWGGPGFGYGYGFGGPSSLGVAALGASAAFVGGSPGSFGSGFGFGGPLGLAGAISPFGGGYWGGGWRGYGGWGSYGGLGSFGGFGGYGGLRGWGGYGGWGGGPWGWYGGSFGAAALGASAAFMSGGSQTGVVTPTNVMQSAPSKASGNYYAPSTADSTASGGYYATTAPAAIPMMQQKAPITNFWGGSGSPLPKDINSVPWAK